MTILEEIPKRPISIRSMETFYNLIYTLQRRLHNFPFWMKCDTNISMQKHIKQQTEKHEEKSIEMSCIYLNLLCAGSIKIIIHTLICRFT